MKKILFITLFILLIIISTTGVLLLLFSAQYNSKGVSHFLVITIDKNQSKEYIGKLDNHNVYIEGLNIDETYFITVSAKHMSVEEAINKKVVSIKEWKKYAWRRLKKDDYEILRYDNYEIVINKKECIIRPISK